MTAKQNTDGKNNFSDQSKQTLVNNYHNYEYRGNHPFTPNFLGIC